MVFCSLVWVLGWGTEFDAEFTGKTLRWDFFHSGNSAQEHLSLDQVRLEGGWPGSRTQLLDETNLGLYLFEVIDRATNRVLYSRGFCSIFGEWQTTGEAKKTWRTFHESLRFPEPRFEVQLVLKKRAPDGAFREIHCELVDPASRFIQRAALSGPGEVISVEHHGPAETKVDLLFLGDGYTEEEKDKLVRDVQRLSGELFEVEPYHSRRDEFNVWVVFVPAAESGVTDPRGSVFRSSPFGLSYNAFDTDRYMLTFENKQLREAAAKAPYDAMILLANTSKYGGGGIFNLWSTAAADSSQAPYLIVHEFGHALAGLADEYYTSQVAYEELTPPGCEPWEPNVTALLEPADLKWREFVDVSTPLPTPWEQQPFDQKQIAHQNKRQAAREAGAKEEQLAILFAEEKTATLELLEAEPHRGRVGAFEGAGYQAKGLYRPELDCIMFTRNPTSYCRVCARAVSRVIDLHSR